jgi:hypothetical protein
LNNFDKKEKGGDLLASVCFENQAKQIFIYQLETLNYYKGSGCQKICSSFRVLIFYLTCL